MFCDDTYHVLISSARTGKSWILLFQEFNGFQNSHAEEYCGADGHHSLDSREL